MRVRSLSLEDPLEEGMATHSSILAWRITWTEEPGRLQCIGSQRVGHNCTHARMCPLLKNFHSIRISRFHCNHQLRDEA